MKVAIERERVRTETRHRREALTSEERTRRSQRIVDATTHWIQREGLDAVMLYLSMRSEVETTSLLEGLLDLGKQVYAPVVDTEQVELVPTPDPASESGVGAKPLRHVGTQRDMPTLSNRTPSAHCGSRYIAFDRKGYRLGYGKGFYDRFLTKCPRAVAIGLAYRVQLVEDTFPQEWDVPVQHIFTETGRIGI